MPGIRLAQAWQGSKEDPALGNCLRYGLRAVHVREGVQDFLGAIGQLALRLFEIPHRHCRMRGPHDHRKTQLSIMARSRFIASPRSRIHRSRPLLPSKILLAIGRRTIHTALGLPVIKPEKRPVFIDCSCQPHLPDSNRFRQFADVWRQFYILTHNLAGPRAARQRETDIFLRAQPRG
jgi:hypothetical protein